MNKNFIVNSYKAEFRMDKYRDDLIEKYDSEVKIDGLKDLTDDYVNALIEYENEKIDKVVSEFVNDLINKFKDDLKHSLFICLNEIENENMDEIVNVLIDKFKDYLIEYDLMDKFEDYLMEYEGEKLDEIIDDLNEKYSHLY